MVADETRLSLRDAAAAEGVAVGTIRRWALCGIAGRRLEHFRRGGRIYTSAEALRRFYSRATADATPKPPASTPRRAETARWSAMIRAM